MKPSILYILILFSLVHCKDYTKEENTTAYQRYINHLNDTATSVTDQEKYLDSTSNLLSSRQNDLTTRKQLLETAGIAYNLELYEPYIQLSRKLYVKSQKENDSVHIAKALYYIGDYHELHQQLDSAYYYHSKSNKLYQALNDTLLQVKTSIYKAGILFDEGIYNESEAEILKTLKLLTSKADSRTLLDCYNQLSVTLSQNSQYKEALFYQNKAQQKLNELKKSQPEDAKRQIFLQSMCYNNTGNILDKLLEFDQAKDYYLKGMAIPNLKQDKPATYAMLLNNYGNNLMLRNQHKEAFPFLMESSKIRDSIHLKAGIITSKIRLGDYYIHYNDTTTALKYWREAYALAKESQSNDEIIRSLKLLSTYDAKNSQIYSDLYFKTQDSLKNVEISTRNKFARIEYETTEVEQKNEILVRRVSLLGIAIAVLAFLTLAIFFIFRLQAKNKRLRYLQEQQNSKEVIYKLLLQQDEHGQQVLLQERNRIAKELHDGIINTLFSIKLHLNQVFSSESIQKEGLLVDIENASQQIRRISHDLKDSAFAQSNFSVLIQALIDKQSTESTIFESLIANNIDWSNFTYDQKINIYRILQEAIQNVLKHAQATSCLIVLMENATSYVLKIQDNGIGFNTAKIRKGIGLRNFDERVNELEATLTVESKLGAGTTLKIEIPKKELD